MSRGHFGSKQGSGQVTKVRPGQVRSSPTYLLRTPAKGQFIIHYPAGTSYHPRTYEEKKTNPSGWILGSRTGKEGLLDDDEGCDGADGRSVH